MLRNRPKPPGDAVLSIDVGSQNAGICCFDSRSQRILYWRKMKLLDEHQCSIADTKPVIDRLEDIYDTVQTQLNSRPFWVLLERQHLDQQSKQKINPLLFNSQLEMICSTFFNMKGCVVRTVEPSLRYPFLGIHEWKKFKRHARKKQVVQKVQELLTQSPGNAFAARQHDLSQWNSTSHRTDMADSLAQCLYFYFRNKGNLLEGKVVTGPPQQAAEQLDTPAPAPKRKKVIADKPPKATQVQAALEKLLTDLEIKQYNRVKGLKTNAARVFAAHKHNPERTREFMLLLNKFNQKTKGINSEQHLAHRLAHLKQP
jgi:Holliday junction resolvasome RuvABC endonuclease subunit